jgi:hypothetical protein
MTYSFLIISSAANLASGSDAESSGVTKLVVVRPRMKSPECAYGIILTGWQIGMGGGLQSAKPNP